MDITLDRAITGFRMSNEAAGLSKKTYTWYERNLRLFLKWLSEKGAGPLITDVTSAIIREYLTQLRTDEQCIKDHPYRPVEYHPLSPRTIQGYYASLSSFFNWAVREELISASPMKNVPRPRVPRYIPNPFSESEVRALLKACGELTDRSKFRLMAMILFLLDTGARIGELLSLKIQDVELDQGRARVMGKGAKERFVFFGKLTKNALWRYMSLARPEPAMMVEELFLYHDGRPIKYRMFTHWLKQAAQKAGVENVHPHRFRRTAAVQFIRNGGDIFALQKLLGHESLEMVRRYVELASEDVERAHRKASPVDGWRL